MSAPTVEATTVETDLPTGWRGPILPLNTRSGDGREFLLADGDEPGIRPLPLPLSAQEKLADAHDGSIVVGLITRAWAENGYLWAEGPFDLHDDQARDWAAKLGRGHAGWVSADVFDVTVEQVPLDRDGGEITLTAIEDIEPVSILYRVPSWRLGGVTLVSSPAFGDVRIEPVYGEEFTAVHAQAAITAAATEHTGAMIALVPSEEDAARFAVDGYEPPEELHVTLAYLGEGADWAPDQRTALETAIRELGRGVPMLGSVWGHASFNPAGDDPCAVYLVEAEGLHDLQAAVHGAIAETSGPEIPENHAFIPHMTAAYGMPVSELSEVGPIRFDRIRLEFAGETTDIDLEPVTSGLVAAGILYEASDFDQPEPDEPVGLTITNDGRVYGHLAAWGSCHIGFPDVCITPPEYDNNDYHFFHQGYAPTTDGLIPVGKITFRTGHAGLRMHAQAAAAHYDNTGAVAAVVRCQDGIHGPWLSGRLVPGLDDQAIAEIQRSGVSGDWREIRETRNSPKRMELVAALSVNVPGFPRPRPKALAASGYKSLIAAGALAPNVRKTHAPTPLTPEDRNQIQFFSLAEFNAKVATEIRAARIRDRRSETLAARVRAASLDALTRRIAASATPATIATTKFSARLRMLESRMALARIVRTPAGAKRYGVPIGSPIPPGGGKGKKKPPDSKPSAPTPKPSAGDKSDGDEKVRRVRTEAGAKRYGLPIGSVIPAPKRPAAKKDKPKPAPVEAPRPDSARRFDNTADGQNWASEHWDITPGDLAPDQAAAVRDYTNFQFGDINAALRYGDVTPTRITSDRIANIDAAIEGAPRVPETFVATRITGMEQFGLEASVFPTPDLEGREFIDRGFMSTEAVSTGNGLDNVTNYQSIIMRVTVPEGTSALYLSNNKKNRSGLSKYGAEENELLIGRGARFRVDLVEPGDVTRTARSTRVDPAVRLPVVHVTILGQERAAL